MIFKLTLNEQQLVWPCEGVLMRTETLLPSAAVGKNSSSRNTKAFQFMPLMTSFHFFSTVEYKKMKQNDKKCFFFLCSLPFKNKQTHIERLKALGAVLAVHK